MVRKQRRSSRISAPAPAPGELDFLQAFANTVDLKAGTDALASPKQLADWLAQRDLLAADRKLTKADLGRALDVRDGLRALVAANSGAGLDVEAISRLDRAARGARPQVRFYVDGTSRFESEELNEALGRLMALVVMARLNEVWDRFNMCANSECQAVFYNHSNRSTTKWCSRRCGDLIRARKYRSGRKYSSSQSRRKDWLF